MTTFAPTKDCPSCLAAGLPRPVRVCQTCGYEFARVGGTFSSDAVTLYRLARESGVPDKPDYMPLMMLASEAVLHIEGEPELFVRTGGRPHHLLVATPRGLVVGSGGTTPGPYPFLAGGGWWPWDRLSLGLDKAKLFRFRRFTKTLLGELGWQYLLHL